MRWYECCIIHLILYNIIQHSPQIFQLYRLIFGCGFQCIHYFLAHVVLAWEVWLWSHSRYDFTSLFQRAQMGHLPLRNWCWNNKLDVGVVLHMWYAGRVLNAHPSTMGLRGLSPVPRRFLGIIGQDPRSSKSNQLHVDIFQFYFIHLR